MRAVTAMLAAAMLAACAEGQVAGFGPAVVGGGGGLPQARVVARSDSMAPPGRRELGIAVRTFARETDGSQVEIRGATCSVRGGPYAVRVTTPVRLVVPDLGPDAPTLEARCQAGGLAGAAAVAPSFGWASSGGTAPERVTWGLGWTYGYEKVGPMRYGDLLVGLSETTR